MKRKNIICIHIQRPQKQREREICIILCYNCDCAYYSTHETQHTQQASSNSANKHQRRRRNQEYIYISLWSFITLIFVSQLQQNSYKIWRQHIYEYIWMDALCALKNSVVIPENISFFFFLCPPRSCFLIYTTEKDTVQETPKTSLFLHCSRWYVDVLTHSRVVGAH